jgi:hypothetical protein
MIKKITTSIPNKTNPRFSPTFGLSPHSTPVNSVKLEEAIKIASKALSYQNNNSWNQSFLKPAGDIIFNKFGLILRKTKEGKVNVVVQYSNSSTNGEFTVAKGTLKDVIQALKQQELPQKLTERLQSSSNRTLGL